MHNFHVALVYARLQHHSLDARLMGHVLACRRLMLRSYSLRRTNGREVFAPKSALLEHTLAMLRWRVCPRSSGEVFASKPCIWGCSWCKFTSHVSKLLILVCRLYAMHCLGAFRHHRLPFKIIGYRSKTCSTGSVFILDQVSHDVFNKFISLALWFRDGTA